MIKVKAVSTFSFRKLEREIDNIEDEYYQGFGQQLVEDSKRFISKGGVKPPQYPKLKESTKNIRQKEGFRRMPALLKSGLLVDTLESKKDGIYGQDYALLHIKGKNRPKRDFFHTQKGNYRKSFLQRIKPLNTELVKTIESKMRISGTGRKGSLRQFLKK